MLSFKSIAGFLKKVSSSGRDDAGRDAKQKAGAETGANNAGASSSASEGVNSGKGTLANRSAAAGLPGTHSTKKNDDTSFIESPLFGMPSAFGDNSMFASSSILKGLPPNTSTQDVLRHIQRVVQERSEALHQQQQQQQQEDEAATAEAAEGHVGAGAEPLSNLSPRSTHSLLSTAAPSPLDVVPVNSGGARTGGTFAAEAPISQPNTAPTTTAHSPTSPAADTRERLQSLQKIRAEMIDALDVCLQEVPENTIAEEEKVRPDKTAATVAAVAAGGGSADGRNMRESMTQSNCVVSPSSSTSGPSGLLEGADAGAGGSAAEAPNMNWGENTNNSSALLDSTRTEMDVATPRDPSTIATPVESAELSMVAVPYPDSSSSPASSPAPAAPVIFTHYEWRCLLLQIVEVIVRIDRVLLADVRRRAMEKFALGVPAASSTSPSGSTTEFRWQRLSQVLPAANDKAASGSLTPTRQARQPDVDAAAALLTSPQLRLSRSEALPRSPEDVELLVLPIPTVLITTAATGSEQPTPKESPLPPSGGAHTATGTGTAAYRPSLVGKMRRALEENSILSPDSSVGYSVSKEDKKILEEMLTVACLLATWAIIKAILRHHLQMFNNNGNNRRRNSKANGGVGSGGGSASAGIVLPETNAPSGSAERAALDMSLSGMAAELVATGNSVAGAGRRPPLASALPPLAPSAPTNGAAEEHSAEEAGAGPLSKKTSHDADPYDDLPYIDWEAVVQELDGWMGNSPGHFVAECTLCASFLRDDGREMVMCMLQEPKPRHLLANIHRHAEKLRHTDPTVLATAAPTSTPMASPRVVAAGTSGAPTSATLSPSPSTSLPSSATNAATNTTPCGTINTTTISGGGGSGAATMNPTSTASAAPPNPIVIKMSPPLASSIQAMMDDPTLVMDDLVAQLELVYRRAVSDTWCAYLENAIEAEMTMYANSIVPRSTSDATMTDKSDTNEKTSPAVPQSSSLPFIDESFLKQQSAASTQFCPSAPESPRALEGITDTTTLCRLATAYFFGSDNWAESKRERRFAVLYRSMRSRMERYSVSAMTRRNIRRGTSSAASPTQVAATTTTAFAAAADANTLSEPVPPPATASASPSQQQQKTTSCPSAAATGITLLVPPTISERASLLQTCTSPQHPAPAVALTPTKFSVEDTSSRGTGAAAATGTAPSPSHFGSSASAASPALSHRGLPNSQLVAHQLLSSNASNAAASNYSTPLAGSLQLGRDGGGSDVETASGALHIAHPTNNAADPYASYPADQSATWTPFGFIMTLSGNTTPAPEADPMLSSQQPNQTSQQPTQTQQTANIGETPIRSEGDSTTPSFLAGGDVAPAGAAAFPPRPPPPPSLYPFGFPLSGIALERIVNMAWSAALHKRGEQCLSAKPPRLEEAEKNAQEERLVAGVFGEFRARQRSLVSLINARLAAGKSVEALRNAQKHFRFEKKDWTGHSQTIFSALRYLQSMVLLVRAQAACRVYGAVIETVQFVLPQARLCEQMLQVLAPRPRRDCIIRFADCRSKLLRSYVYLLKECWMAHAAFNDHAKAAKYFSQCAQVLQMLRRRSRESELFAAYMERGSQLMKTKDYKKSVEIFKLAVNIAKKSLQDADTAAAASAVVVAAAAMGTANNASSTATSGLGAKSGATTAAPRQHFHRNLHFRSAGSGQLYTAEEHIIGTSAAAADDLEFAWRVAESERMLALSYVTQAEHEVNVRERREELSNAVSNAYSSQRSLQRWQTKGGTPKRLLTAVPCSLIVICKGLLLLNQARKAALLLEPLIEHKPSSALVRPPMWREILDPTEDPYTAEDVVLRTYVCSVKIAVYMLYARCLAEFDGERALRAVTQVDQLLQESDAWIYTIRTKLRGALEEVRGSDKNVSPTTTSPYATRNLELPRLTAPATAAKTTAAAAAAANDESDDGVSATKPGGGGADTTASAASPILTTDVPPLHMNHMNAASLSIHRTTNNNMSTTGASVARRKSTSSSSYHSPEFNSPEDAPLRPRCSNTAGGDPGSGVDPSRENPAHDDDHARSRQSTVPQTHGGSADADFWNNGNSSVSGAFLATQSSGTSGGVRSTSIGPAKASPSTPTLRVHMESASECMTALFALREGKSHIRKALRDIFIISGDAQSLIKNWEEALKSYSHALVISMSEVEAANAAAQSRRRASQYATPSNAAPSPRTSTAGGNHDDTNSLATSQVPANVAGAANVSHQATVGGAGSSTRGGGGDAVSATATTTNNYNNAAGITAMASSSATQCWGQVVPLDEEFFLWDEEDGLLADNLLNRDLAASTAAKDLRAVVADEERMDSRACESLVLSKLANVYRALDKPTTAIHYHNLVLDYANECNDKLLAYNSMLSLARLYTAAGSLDEARETWAKVSDLAKEYEDKEVSRETKRNIVAGQESAGMYLDVVKTAEELEKLATGEEGEDAAADRRFALEALANANLQLGQYDACIAALDNREKVQEKSAEWNGRLLSMRAKARMGLNKPADAIKVMQSWAAKARNLCNWVELGRANSALSAAYASESQNMQARHYHEATLNAFALAETLNEDCQHIALDSARWLVHYAYLDDSTVQVDPALTYTGGCLTSDSEASGGDFRYTDSGLCNSSGDLGVMLAKEEELRRSSSSFMSGSLHRGDGSDEEEDDFFGGGNGSGGALANNSLFGMRGANLTDSDRPAEPPKEEARDDDEGEKQKDQPVGDNAAEAADKGGAPAAAAGVEEEDESDTSVLRRNLSSSFHPKDPNCATQPPSLAASANPSLRDYPAQPDNLELNFSGSSAGQSEAGDNDAVVEENEDEARRRREVDEALLTMDDDVDALVSQHHASAVSAAVNAAAMNHMFFNMGDVADDAEDVVDTKDATSASELASASAKGTAKAVPTTPNITTAAVKTSSNAAVAGATKSARSNYIPPPTALANVSICSRPAAAAAGTDVLEMPVDAGRSASEPTSAVGSSGTGSPLVPGSGVRGIGFADGRDSAGVAAGTLAHQDGEDNQHERKPATVRTTYYRGAIEMMEAAVQLLLVPRSVSRLVIPYSPAEAIDFVLLAHPHSLFVFYFAEYTTEYGAQCDVVIRPPGRAGFLKLRTQVSLKEYHSKDVVNSLLTNLSAEASLADRAIAPPPSAGGYNHNNVDPGAATSHPFGGAVAKAAAAAAGSSNASASASPTLNNVRPDALRTALDDETRSCLFNLHADAWQPIIDRMRREHVSYEDAETLIIMPDIALLHLPFAGLMPSPHYGGEDAPLGEQFTLIVTPSLTHFVYHGMTAQHDQSDALDPTANRYIFIPYDAISTGATVAAKPQMSTGVAAADSSAPSSPHPRQQSSQATRSAACASQLVLNPSSSTGAPMGKPTNSASSTASPLSWPSVTPPHSNGGSTLLAQASTAATASAETTANAASATRRDSAFAAVNATGADASADGAAAPADHGTFDGLLKTWQVHRGCTRKELIHAFANHRTRALMFLGPIDQGGVRVADGVVTLQDIIQSLQHARAQPATQGGGGGNTAGSGVTSGTTTNNNSSQSTSGAAQTHVAPAAVPFSPTPAIPLPPLCTHMDLLILTADRGFYPSVTNAGMTANLCMSLGVRRVLRLNVIRGLDPNEEHREFIAHFLSNLRKVMRWKLSNPYAVALRTTIAEARAKGMSSNTWGAFTLIGSA
ncbi:hypothetical protein ABB37_04530 [Leptomonas pyrrhocoris]|uniref:Uncharacterized protein n=1 Tax=Leptomonas pyrrhocoris TaxID=157538 RepID=A0A0N0DW28_LEPPY|nr:hypothetical protein ABB37_04530 [Leptomonas pyrrhocoris]KPA81192.1 hypothetical protein ABB37_04530 [Leptomonas pyrrhocoris]|eukprot:XP_015659631.1 hypothetical protein ABB37_04530 [Leptomonas pyrrhocoris]